MTVIFDGLASGTLLFLIAVGLSVTLGLMKFVNLAHGALAMAGGYALVTSMNRLQIPFLAALPLAALASALLGAILERTLYRRLYTASSLDQVLFSIGLLFVAISSAHFLFGDGQQPLHLPPYLSGQFHLGPADLGAYRLFLIALGLLIAAALHLLVTQTRFGAQLRAAVDSPVTAAALGIDTSRLFTLTFALGSGLAGLGGALGIEMLGLSPEFPLTYIVYFLVVVAMGGIGNIASSLIAALILGIADVEGKYLLPQLGPFIIYLVMLLTLLFRPQGLFGRTP